jgi:hypothetical protein
MNTKQGSVMKKQDNECDCMTLPVLKYFDSIISTVVPETALCTYD